jgi:hypothetical protein
MTTASTAARKPGSFPASRARALMDSSSSSGGKGVDRAPGLAAQVVALGRGAGDGRQKPAAGQDRAERVQPGLPSGRAVARNATGKHGVPGGAGWPRPKAVMPGQSIAAAAAISGAPDSNSRQVATMPLSRAAGQPRLPLTHLNGRPEYLIREPICTVIMVCRVPVNGAREWVICVRCRQHERLTGGRKYPVGADPAPAGPAESVSLCDGRGGTVAWPGFRECPHWAAAEDRDLTQRRIPGFPAGTAAGPGAP